MAPALNLNTHDAALMNQFINHYYQRASGFQGLAAVNAAAPTITMCGDSSYHAQNVQINIDPALPAKGTKFTVTGSGTVDKAITQAAHFENMLYLGYALIQTHSGSACGQEKWGLPLGLGDITYNGLSCPAAVGDVNLEMEVNVKPYAPSGMYTAHISAKDQDGENLLCVKVTFAL